MVTAGVTDIKLSWTNNESRLLAGVLIKHDENADDTQLSESNAVQVFSGLAGSFVYTVDTSNPNNFHQFWVSSLTKS